MGKTKSPLVLVIYLNGWHEFSRPITEAESEEKQKKSKHRLPLVASDLQISILSLSADSITPMSLRYICML